MSDKTGSCLQPDNAAKSDTLTAEEREAIAGCFSDDEAAGHYTRADTLRGLLERLGGGE
jgi:hypothetical protein